jgi:predicted  nucleic acid-binding Zn-ribbon protein
MRVGDAVRSAVEASNETLTRKLSDIADSFNRLVDGSRDTASGVINDAMKGAFDATLRQASDSIGHVAASLKDLPERVSAAAASIQNAGETATKQQAEMAETIKKGIEELLRETTKQVSNDIRSGTQDFVSDLKETGSTFGDSAAKINSFLERFDDNVEGYAKSLASLSEQNGRLESNLSNISERLIAASNSISMAGQNVDGSIQKLLAWNKDFTRVATETFNVSKESQKSIRDTVESLQQQMRTHIQRFDSVDEKLAGVFNSIASHLELQSRQMSEQFTRMDNALGSAVNQFELIIDGLADFTGNRRAAE